MSWMRIYIMFTATPLAIAGWIYFGRILLDATEHLGAWPSGITALAFAGLYGLIAYGTLAHINEKIEEYEDAKRLYDAQNKENAQ